MSPVRSAPPVAPPLMRVALICVLLSMIFHPVQALAGKRAKSIYMTADAYHQRLKKSAVRQQKISAWLTCIDKYKTVYRRYPDDSWAPAGMFKAAELYLQLYKRSGNGEYLAQARELAARISRKYPKSAYNGRAKILEKSMSGYAAKPGLSPDIKVLTSKKAQTRDNGAMIEYKRQKRTKLKTLVPVKTGGTVKVEPITEDADLPDPLSANLPQTAPAPGTVDPVESLINLDGDARVTDLRFWSNPEYTRIVVNAEGERPYSHRLLKKDPALNVPFQRLYVDIDQARLGSMVPEHTPINDDLLKQARAGQFQPHTVRVVVDIKDFENYKIFSLKDPFRIVIDIWGKNGRHGSTDQILAGNSAAPGTQTPDTQASGQQPSGKDQSAPAASFTGKPDQITTDNLKSSDIARQLALGVSKIVIDPGHGGKDPGAPGYIKGVWEKDIVLKLSKNLAEKLKKRLNCEVLLTRTTDEKLSLEERTAIANTKRADLFISMHCNAAKSRKLSGIETYILNLATDDQAIAVAARENATSEKNISDLEYILSDLMKHAKIEESTRLANDVHRAMIKGMQKKYPKVNDLGVKQAPFYVLLGARMPSILVESSFISNKVECNRLMTESYRDAICNAIADGVETYINATNPKHL